MRLPFLRASRVYWWSGAGGPAPVRRFLPHPMELVLERKIEPGKVFDLTLPLPDVAEGYRAMDERRAIKTASWCLIDIFAQTPITVARAGRFRAGAGHTAVIGVRGRRYTLEANLNCWLPGAGNSRWPPASSRHTYDLALQQMSNMRPLSY